MKLLLLGISIFMLSAGCNYNVDKASRPAPGATGRPNGDSGAGGGAGEGGGGSADPAGNLNFDFVFQNAIKKNCAGCHGAPRNAAGVNLETYENVFTHRGAVEAAVTSRFMPDSLGRMMPEDQRELLLEWLAAGAPREAAPQPVANSPVVNPVADIQGAHNEASF